MISLSGLSLKARLLAGSLILIVVALLITGLVLTAMFRSHVEQRFASELSTHLDQLLAGLRAGSHGSLNLARPMSDPRFDQPYSGLYWQVDGPNGTILRSRSLWDLTLSLPHDAPADGQLHRHRLRGPEGQSLLAVERRVDLPGRSGVVRAAVAEDFTAIQRATASFTGITVVSLGALALVLLLAVGLQVFSTLHPLGRLQSALAAVRLGRTARVSGRFPTELQPLVDDLNGLIAHNAQVLERTRAEAGNLAHHLKTPLAIIANAARALPEGSASPVLEQAKLMQRRIDYALSRARAAASGKVLGVTTEASPRLQNLVAAMRVLHGPRGIAIDLSDEHLAVVNVEPQDFDEIIGNLLDNACKWARSRVTLATETSPLALRIVIDDDGPGLPESERDAVFARGRKLDEDAPGAGLGLSIVRDLLDTYGGAIRLDASPLGGLRTAVSVPRATVARDPPGRAAS